MSRKQSLRWFRKTLRALPSKDFGPQLQNLTDFLTLIQDKVQAGEGYKGEDCVEELWV